MNRVVLPLQKILSSAEVNKLMSFGRTAWYEEGHELVSMCRLG